MLTSTPFRILAVGALMLLASALAADARMLYIEQTSRLPTRREYTVADREGRFYSRKIVFNAVTALDPRKGYQLALQNSRGEAVGFIENRLNGATPVDARHFNIGGNVQPHAVTSGWLYKPTSGDKLLYEVMDERGARIFVVTNELHVLSASSGKRIGAFRQARLSNKKMVLHYDEITAQQARVDEVLLVQMAIVLEDERDGWEDADIRAQMARTNRPFHPDGHVRKKPTMGTFYQERPAIAAGDTPLAPIEEVTADTFGVLPTFDHASGYVSLSGDAPQQQHRRHPSIDSLRGFGSEFEVDMNDDGDKFTVASDNTPGPYQQPTRNYNVPGQEHVSLHDLDDEFSSFSFEDAMRSESGKLDEIQLPEDLYAEDHRTSADLSVREWRALNARPYTMKDTGSQDLEHTSDLARGTHRLSNVGISGVPSGRRTRSYP